MAKGDSAQKIARAAKAGATVGGSENRKIAFPVAMAFVVVLGILLVGWSRSNREATSAPRVGDHWHSAYDIYICAESEVPLDSLTFRGGWRPKIVVERDPNGLHTHGDGIIHIHPFNSLASGKDAQMGEFFESFGGYITDSAIKLDTGEVITEGFLCDGAPAVLKIARYDVRDRDRDPQVYTENLSDVQFLKNLEAFTVAFVPEAFTPPPPRPERFTYLETVDPRALLSEDPLLEFPADTTG